MIDQHPEIVKEMQGYFEAFEQELGEGDRVSYQCRPAGYVELAKPLKQ